ncbi:MAG: hypothetical protein IJ791_06775, partial [Lachnospiraceae bacterium]|nr:hypothetical protein [Lachnospiraceae bacterium]
STVLISDSLFSPCLPPIPAFSLFTVTFFQPFTVFLNFLSVHRNVSVSRYGVTREIHSTP